MSIDTSFQGCFTALVTPFTSSGSLDFAAVDRLVARQLDAGISGLVVLGTTGESPTIAPHERVSLIQHIVEAVRGAVPILVGTGSNSTAVAIERAQQAELLGADGLLVASPHYNKPTQTGLIGHFTAIADAVELPLMLYNVPGRTGINIATETVVALAQHPRIVAIKEASGNLDQIMTILGRVPSRFHVLSGDDAMTWPLMSLGGHGVVSVVSNLLPGPMQACVASALEGSPAQALHLHERLLPMMKACFLQTNPLPIKTALAACGLIEEIFRPPLCPMDEPFRSQLLAAVAAFNEHELMDSLLRAA